MLQRSRRRSPYGAYLCAVISAVLLLISVSLLYSRLSLSQSQSHSPPNPHSFHSSLLSDSDDSDLSTSDPIDELDIIDLDQQQQQQQQQQLQLHSNPSLFFFDPISASIRRSFRTPHSSIHQWEDIDPLTADQFTLPSPPEDRSKTSFGSDDVSLNDYVRDKVTSINSFEDLLLLKSSPLRDGWGDWFDKKCLFLKKDRMFRSGFDVFNPMNNPLLQDPDTVGVSGLTRGDKVLQKWWISEFKRVPFPANKNNNIEKSMTVVKGGKERRTLNDNSGDDHIYADGDNWGYFPGLPLRLSFDNFMDEFFRRGKCVMRVFMVWNSPPWMYTVRHQRGLESLLFHHPNACVVVFSETIELDFFKDSFVKDGYKIAVVMPNLDQLLKDTPALIFSSAWSEWKKTKFYSTHYSELIRLAALYKSVFLPVFSYQLLSSNLVF